MNLIRIFIALFFAIICSASFGQNKNNQDTVQLENAGKRYLAEVITKAKYELMADGVRSLTSDKLAA